MNVILGGNTCSGSFPLSCESCQFYAYQSLYIIPEITFMYSIRPIIIRCFHAEITENFIFLPYLHRTLRAGSIHTKLKANASIFFNVCHRLM